MVVPENLITAHPDIKKIAFGSTEVGKKIIQSTATQEKKINNGVRRQNLHL